MYTQDNRKPKEITRMLQAVHTEVSYRTVARLISVYKRTGEIVPKPKGGSHPDQETPDVICKRIRELVLENNEHSASTIQCQLDLDFEGEDFYITPGLSTIYALMHRMNLSKKVLRVRPKAYNSYKTKHARWKYVHDVAIPLLKPENVIFIDETPMASHQKRTHGWSPIGKPAFRKNDVIKGKNHSVIAAISPIHGLISYRIKRTEKDARYQTKGVGEQVFREFTKELLSMDMFKKKDAFYFFVMDNVNFHKNCKTKDLYNKKHHHTLLSPYSPFLNPIEYTFGHWKSKFRRLEHRNDDEVMDAIDRSAEKMNEDLSYYMHVYKHVQKYYPRVLNMEDIDD
jgi:hypothetical protein